MNGQTKTFWRVWQWLAPYTLGTMLYMPVAYGFATIVWLLVANIWGNISYGLSDVVSTYSALSFIVSFILSLLGVRTTRKFHLSKKFIFFTLSLASIIGWALVTIIVYVINNQASDIPWIGLGVASVHLLFIAWLVFYMWFMEYISRAYDSKRGT